jgi:type VII secretion protein EccE
MSPAPSRLHPARPGWLRLSALACALLLGWAALIPAGSHPQWWHWPLTGLLIAGFLGSWHGQHVSTTATRWVPMAWRNRRRRRRHPGTAEPATPAAVPQATPLRGQITIHLRPHPHALRGVDDHDDQLPWQFVTAWLDRYGITADTVTVCSVTRTPPPSSLRSDAAAHLSARTPQHRDTWITYTLTADSNAAALCARRTAISTLDDPTATGPEDPSEPVRQRAGLAAVTARRLTAELREQGWLATLCDTDSTLPVFVPSSVAVRR